MAADGFQHGAFQHTLRTPAHFAGVGVHTGAYTRVTIRPAPVDAGVVFVRTDVTDRDNRVPATGEAVCKTQLGTVIGNDAGVTVATIEHLMAAFAMLGVDNALVELDYAGVVMQPRQQPPACNTRLSVVARSALKPILGEEQVTEIEKQVDGGKLSLADLDSLAEKGKDISTGLLALIFGSANQHEVALAFLGDDRFDEAISKKEAQKELRFVLQAGFDVDLPVAV